MFKNRYVVVTQGKAAQVEYYDADQRKQAEASHEVNCRFLRHASKLIDQETGETLARFRTQ